MRAYGILSVNSLCKSLYTRKVTVLFHQIAQIRYLVFILYDAATRYVYGNSHNAYDNTNGLRASRFEKCSSRLVVGKVKFITVLQNVSRF